VDLLVCVVLAIAAATATRWLLDRLRPQFTLGVMFGLVTFICIEGYSRWHWYWQSDHGLRPIQTVEFVLVVYSVKVTWFCIFLACLVMPNLICQWLGFLRRSVGTPNETTPSLCTSQDSVVKRRQTD
jgi:hypothetical protein